MLGVSSLVLALHVPPDEASRRSRPPAHALVPRHHSSSNSEALKLFPTTK